MSINLAQSWHIKHVSDVWYNLTSRICVYLYLLYLMTYHSKEYTIEKESFSTYSKITKSERNILRYGVLKSVTGLLNVIPL